MTVSLGTVIWFQNPAQWRRPWTEVYESSLAFAALAERLGLDRVWLTEHHFTDDGYCPSLLPGAAAIASRTERIRIGTKVMLLPFHDPFRLAEDAAVVDILSNGRLDLGVAAGYRSPSSPGSRTWTGHSVVRDKLMAGGLVHRDAHGTVTTVHGRSHDDSAPIERGRFGSLPWSWAQAIEFFTAS